MIEFRLRAACLAAAATVSFAGIASASDASLTLDAADAPAPEILAPQDAVLLAALQDEAAAAAPAEEEAVWKSKVSAGGSASFGNTDKQDVFAVFTTSREKGDQKTSVGAAYYYGASDGDRTDNEFEANIRQDWYLSGTPWEYFAQAKFEYDEFQSWEYRLSGFVGVGYQFEKRDDFELNGRVGVGGSQQFNSPDDEFRWEALIGADLRWDITEATEFTASTEIIPSLSDVGEFRTLSRAGISTLLDEELNMSFTAAVEHEYQSENEAPTEKNDFRVLFGLQFEF
jgi:putative salt-induced outer membrane protein YdiY